MGDSVFDIGGTFTNHGQLDARGNNSINATDIKHYGGMYIDANLSKEAQNEFYSSSNRRVVIEAVTGPLNLNSLGSISIYS